MDLSRDRLILELEQLLVFTTYYWDDKIEDNEIGGRGEGMYPARDAYEK
jgi:hypothetical protein